MQLLELGVFSADMPQGGLEVPWTYKFLGEPEDVAKI